MEADCKENLALSSKFCAQKPKVHASLLIPASVACSCGPSCVCTHYSVQLLALAIHCTLQSICCLVQLCTCLRRTHLAHTSCARVWCTCLAHIVYTQCTHLDECVALCLCARASPRTPREMQKHMLTSSTVQPAVLREQARRRGERICCDKHKSERPCLLLDRLQCRLCRHIEVMLPH